MLNIINLHSFTLFPEYLVSISLIYVLLVVTLISYNVDGLILQNSVSKCLALILLMACYLLMNDDLIWLDFATFNNSIINDYFAFFSKFLICFFSSIYFLLIADLLKEQKLTSFEYLLVILFAVLGLMLTCSSNDLLTTYLAVEMSGLAFYILASFKKMSSYSVKSGMIYFIIGAISSAFFLLGSSFLYGFAGSINFLDFYDLFECFIFDTLPFFSYDEEFMEKNLAYLFWRYFEYIHGIFPFLFDNSFVELGLTFILFSLFIKLALAPFHLWSLDVYEGSPTSSTIFFAVITKLSIFVILVRLCYVSFFSFRECWQFYSLWVGVFSIFVGSFGGLKQRKIKTLLAYSSISHMGYSLIAFSTCTVLGIQALLFHMIIYMISGLSIWSIFLFLRLKRHNSIGKYNKELGDFVLLKKSNPTMAFALALTMFSIAGIPPMVGFLAKMNIFLSIVGITFYFVALVSIVFSVVSTFYYIRLIKVLYFENVLVGKLYYPINKGKTIILSILIFSLIFLFINPTLLYLFSYKVVLSLII